MPHFTLYGSEIDRGDVVSWKSWWDKTLSTKQIEEISKLFTTFINKKQNNTESIKYVTSTSYNIYTFFRSIEIISSTIGFILKLICKENCIN